VQTDEPVPPEFLRMMAERFATLGDPTRLAEQESILRRRSPRRERPSVA
jgi:hypothetical protein